MATIPLSSACARGHKPGRATAACEDAAGADGARQLVALEGAVERGEAGEQAAASGNGHRALRFQIAMAADIGVPATRRPLTQF